MVTRATLQNFLVGLPIAFFSGLGVAVSVLDDSASSLVGVAISASLLPPAVNSGILWVAYGFAKNNWLGSGGGIAHPTLPPAAFISEAPTTGDPELFQDDFLGEINSSNGFDEDYIPSKSDFRKGGMISLGLTLANIVLVIVASIAMFRYVSKIPLFEFKLIVAVVSQKYTNTILTLEPKRYHRPHTELRSDFRSRRKVCDSSIAT
mmetsp:Transcript_26376/g.62799  ORF Transcript_26376/g.62799 Transcript_26376/m.62799 type:complete len:206 (+) Transcript_26376:809-1426(+)